MGNDLFEKAPIPKAYFSFALPVVFSIVISLVYNMADTYFIAATGNTNLVAGVSLGAPIFTLMIALGDIFGLGGSSVISRLFGKKMDEDGKRLSVFCFYGAIVCGIVVAVLMMLFRAQILTLLGAKADTVQYASDYYTWLVIGAPFIILSFTPSNLLRTEGFSVASMTGTVLGSVINIILDPIFIFVLGMGAAGAAIATVIGNIGADLFFVFFLLTKSKRLSINPKGFFISKRELGDIFAIGIPASVTNFMQSLGIALTNRFLLVYGTDKVASMGIVMKINMIAMLILVGFAFGSQPLIGYNYGAGNKKRLKAILAFSYKFECAMGAVLALILCVFAKPLISMFMNQESIVNAGVPMLRLQLAGAVFTAVTLVSTCTFQSAGKALNAFLLSVSRQGVIFAVVIFILSKTVGYYGVLSAQPVSDFLTAVLAVILVRRSVYREIR